MTRAQRPAFTSNAEFYAFIDTIAERLRSSDELDHAKHLHLGALISGWRAPLQIRFCLWIGLVMFLIIWAITPTVFWSMIRELWGSAKGRISHTDAELVQLAHRWIVWDWFRISLIAIGFAASIPAISLPATVDGSNKSPQPTAGRSDK